MNWYVVFNIHGLPSYTQVNTGGTPCPPGFNPHLGHVAELVDGSAVFYTDLAIAAAKLAKQELAERQAVKLSALISHVKTSYNKLREIEGIEVSISSPISINHQMKPFDRDVMSALVARSTGAPDSQQLTTDKYDFNSISIQLTRGIVVALFDAYQTALNTLYQSKKSALAAIEAQQAPTAEQNTQWRITDEMLTAAGIIS